MCRHAREKEKKQDLKMSSGSLFVVNSLRGGGQRGEQITWTKVLFAYTHAVKSEARVGENTGGEKREGRKRCQALKRETRDAAVPITNRK